MIVHLLPRLPMRLRSVLGALLLAALAPAAVQAQPLTRPGRIMGTVFDSTSMRPLAGAMVQVVRLDDPATARHTSTDAQGAFHVDSLPPANYAVATFHPRLDSLGVWQLSRGVDLREGQRARVRLDVPSARTPALGYEPQLRVVDVVRDDTTALILGFDRLAVLDTMRIRASPGSVLERSLAEFRARRKSSGSGRFLGPEDLLKRPPFRTVDLFRNMPGVQVIPSGSGDRVTMRGSLKRGRCTPSIWVDGAPIVSSDDIEFIVPTDFVRAVEVYSSAMTAPAQFSGWSDCGVIVFWTGARK